MGRSLAAWSVMLWGLVPVITDAAPWDKKEAVNLDFKTSVEKKITDESYQKITIGTAAIKGFCEDSYMNSLARNLIGKNNKALLLLTVDKKPIMKMEYDDKKKECTKEELLEKDFSGFELSRNVDRAHRFDLLYSSANNAKLFEHLVSVGAKLPNPTGQLLAQPIAAEVAPFLDEAFASAANSEFNHSITFQMPSNGKDTQVTLTGRVGEGREQPLFNFYLTVVDDLFSSKGYASIMTSPLESKVRPQDALESRRAKEKQNFSEGDLALIKSECGYLKSLYQPLLNEKDMQRMLEAYLLNNHRDALTRASVEKCIGHAIDNPIEELSFKLLADEILSTPNNEKDTQFLSYLYDGQARKVLQKGATFYDKDGDLGFSDMASYVKLKGSTSALCHTYVAYNRPAFVQVINSRIYYGRATVDKEYTKAEAGRGMLSKVAHISLTKNVDAEYESIPGVRQCISGVRQSLGLASTN